MKISKSTKIVEFDDDSEIEILQKRVLDEAPERGSQNYSLESLTFEMLPLSKRTQHGLKEAKIIIPTEIQAASIPHALSGRDILGAARTGSGKTIAFVVPILERLYVERWSVEDGLGAVILTPTRELALQIFDVIRTIGKKHQFSAGLVTGGKKEFEEEQSRITRMNILVATPGRLLQHMEQTPGFDASQILMLILDEADRLLDMGFKQQLDSIIEYLPPRQTLLFSATQTKSVKDLARLSLRDPEYLAVHEKDKEVTPVQLVQNYIVCKLQDKLDILFSFIKSHLKSKIIVFFSTCSQVRFSFECFRSMQPGISLTALHGKIKQERRTIIFMDFNKRKHACMLATDIAARGLDFPAVDWVVQIDAPEDSAMYIHRVGRTARYNADGQALLMLLPHEEEYNCDMLQKTGVPIKKLAVNPKHRISVSAHAAALLVSQPETRALAKKAFLAYIRSLQLLPSNRELDIKSLDLNAFATSLGLAITPDLPMVIQGEQGREVNREKKNVNRSLDKLKKSIQEAKEAKRRAREEAKSKKEKLSTETSNKHDISQISNTEDAEDLFVVRTSGNTGNEPMEIETPMSAPNHAMTKKKQVKLKIRAEGELPKAMRQAGAKKVVFDQFGDEIEPLKLKVVEDRVNNDESQLNTGSRVNIGKMTAHIEAIKQKLDKSRSEDAERDQQRVRDMHKSKRLRYKPEKIEMFGAQLDSHEEERMDDDEAGSQNESEHFSIDDEEEEFKNKVIEKRRQKKRRVSGSDNDINDSDIKLQEEIVLKLLNNLS